MCLVPFSQRVFARGFVIVALGWILNVVGAGSKDLAVAQVARLLQCSSDPDREYDELALTPNGKTVIATDHEGMTAWNVSDGKQVVSLQIDLDYSLLDPKGTGLYFWDDNNDCLSLMPLVGEPSTWKANTLLSGFENDVEPLAVTVDGSKLACKLSYERLGVFDLASKKLVFETAIRDLSDATFSSDGTRLALAFDRSEDAVIVYSVPGGERIAGSASFISLARKLRYSPEGSKLAICCQMSEKYNMVLMEADRLRPIRGTNMITESDPGYCSLDWSMDGQFIVVGRAGGSTRSEIFDAVNYKSLSTLPGFQVSAVKFNGDSSQVISVSDDEAGVVFWDWKSNLRFREATRVLASHPVLDKTADDYRVHYQLRYSPDGKSLALAMPAPNDYNGKPPLQNATEPGLKPLLDFSRLDHEAEYILLLDAQTGRPTKAIVSKSPELVEEDGDRMYEDQFTQIRFSPDSKSLATLLASNIGSSGHLVIWDVGSTRPRIEMLIRMSSDKWNDGWIDLDYLDDGKTLLLLPKNHDDWGMQWFDLETSTLKASTQGEFGQSLLPLAGGQVASGLATWDYVNGEALYRHNGGYANYYLQLAHGNGSILGVYDGNELGRWDLDSLKLTFPYAAHRGDSGLQIYSLATSPNRRLVATACADHLIRIWDANTGCLLMNLKGHSRAVDALTFSPDGSTLASASRDGTTRFWQIGDLSADQPIAEAADLPTRRTFQTENGGSVTVVFENSASDNDIGVALQQALSSLKP